MGEMTIRVDDATLVALQEAALRRGLDPADLARDLIAYTLKAGPRSVASEVEQPGMLSDEDGARRRELLTELREIRAMTLQPLVFDSTLMIREMRDSDG